MLIYFTNSSSFLPMHIISNTTDLIGKVFKYWEAVTLAVMVYVFQIPNFCLKARILSLATIQSVAILEASDPLPSFSRKPVPGSQNRIRGVCLSIVLSKGLEFSSHSNECRTASPQDNHPTSACSRSALRVLPINVRRCVLRDWDLIKLILCVSVFFKAQYVVVKKMTTRTVQCQCHVS